MANINNIDLATSFYTKHQAEAFHRLAEALQTDKPFVMRAGIVAGKTYMLELAGTQFDRVFVVDHTERSAKQSPICGRRQTVGLSISAEAVKDTAKGHNPLGIQPTDLVVFDNGFWYKLSDRLWKAVQKLTPHVVLISSSGPYDFPDELIDAKYATWDLNPERAYQSPALLDQFRHNWNASARDYGLADSHDPAAEAYLREAVKKEE